MDVHVRRRIGGAPDRDGFVTDAKKVASKNKTLEFRTPRIGYTVVYMKGTYHE